LSGPTRTFQAPVRTGLAHLAFLDEEPQRELDMQRPGTPLAMIALLE
jgi:hypothetical protein